MNNFQFALDGARQVLVAGLLLGAGLPALFALGVRFLALGSTATETDVRPTAAGRVLAGICFFLVIYAVVLGITFIAASGFGKALVFDSIVPSLVDK